MTEPEQQKRRWVYIVTVILIFTLIGFSTLPLISSVIDANQSVNQKNENQFGLSSSTQIELDAAIKGYELVLEREPNNQSALLGLLEARLKQGDIQGAIVPLEKLALMNEELNEYTILLAQAKEKLGDYQGALDAYNRILVKNPVNLRAVQGSVNVFFAQEMPDKALSLVQQTLNKAKQIPVDESNSFDLTSIQLLLGEIYAYGKQYPEAIAVYDQIIEVEDQDFRPRLAKAVVLENLGKNSEAKSLLEQALSLAPDMYKEQIKQIGSQINSAQSVEENQVSEDGAEKPKS